MPSFAGHGAPSGHAAPPGHGAPPGRAAPPGHAADDVLNILVASDMHLGYGERDQISLAYVLLRMGLAAGGANASAALRLIPRTMHYLTKPSARALQIVQKVGHRSGTRRIH